MDSKINLSSMDGVLTRALSGVVYIAVILAGLLLGKTVFVIFLSLLSLVALMEFYGLVNSHRERPLTLLADLLGGLVISLSFSGYMLHHSLGIICPVLTVVYMIVRLVMQLYCGESHPLENLAYSYMGHFYITIPLGFMALIYLLSGGTGHLLLAMFVMIWLNDTGAYCVGSSIGRHRLFPRISPKKSWEGFFGGVFFAILGGAMMAWLFPTYFVLDNGTPLTIPLMIGMGLLVSVIATWGDLVESLIKRTLGVKDSGSLIPGHGGILDRIDSLLLVAPAVLLYVFSLIVF